MRYYLIAQIILYLFVKKTNISQLFYNICNKVNTKNDCHTPAALKIFKDANFIHELWAIFEFDFY
jgi:hypothetical protein